MSDNFRVLGIGGAGVNVVRELGYRNSAYIDSSSFETLQGVEEFIKGQGRNEKVVIVSSPAGGFSSMVLRTVCNALNSNGNRVYLIGILPFHSESPERKKRGEVVLRELGNSVETTEIVDNENFASSMREYGWTFAMSKINEYVGGLVRDLVIQGDERETIKAKEVPIERGQGMFVPNQSVSMN